MAEKPHKGLALLELSGAGVKGVAKNLTVVIRRCCIVNKVNL